MDANPTLRKDQPPPSSQDYEFLRTEGLKYIESLSSDLWTDYNTHDPGITIMEALCYALTELGYRNGFPMKDLLTGDNGRIFDGQNMFTARKILTNNPLTINDYRKLLVDLDGIHNAFLFAECYKKDPQGKKIPVNEVSVYANCQEDKLQYTPETDVPLFLNGLYRVLLDLDYDNRLGDLNNGIVVLPNPPIPYIPSGSFMFSIGLPPWKSADFSFASKASEPGNILSSMITVSGHHWKCRLRLINTWEMTFDISIPKKPEGINVDTADIQLMFDQHDFVESLFKLYFDKILLAEKRVKEAVRILQEHRNLCEDFPEVTTLDSEEIAFCFDVDVKPDADIEKVQAEIFFAIENYLNPSVDFYSLKEMLDRKIPTEEIFLGVQLNNGFIDTAQLEKTQLRRVIHTSDIINLLMDIDGVLAIRNFLMTKYDSNGTPVANYTGLKWCMDIAEYRKPVLSTDKSKILLFKNNFPFLAQYEEVRDTILLLHAQRTRAKKKGLENDLAIVVGKKRETTAYRPVQYDLPQTYGTGIYGLPANASLGRISQQRQLKAYLMFYDQLLADFLSQLSNAYKLFSVDDIRQTYFAQFLKDIKDMDAVYNSNIPPGKLEDVLANQDSTALSRNRWQELYEPKDVFEERRNRFLDHLLARFAESFNDYALLMYSINYNDKTEEKIDFTELSASKIRTLKEYDVISSERGKGYNYFPQLADFTLDTSRLWDTDNVSGLEKKISFLSGISDYSRRFLYCIRNLEILCNEEEIIENGNTVLHCFHSFSVTTLNGLRMHSGVKYETLTEARQAVLDVTELGDDVAAYLFDTTTSRLLLIGKSNENLLESDDTYPDKPSAMAVAAIFAKEFSAPCNDPVGMHLVEHILLRPRTSEYKLMEVCLYNCDCRCETDPYSFRASVVLPYWPGHFDSMEYREYFENKIREEAPAHIMLKICWLNNELMREFEVLFKAWTELLAQFSYNKQANAAAFRDANDHLIEILSRLHSEYPKATLHDCSESKEGKNTVVLGKTVLGTFKN